MQSVRIRFGIMISRRDAKLAKTQFSMFRCFDTWNSKRWLCALWSDIWLFSCWQRESIFIIEIIEFCISIFIFSLEINVFSVQYSYSYVAKQFMPKCSLTTISSYITEFWIFRENITYLIHNHLKSLFNLWRFFRIDFYYY